MNRWSHLTNHCIFIGVAHHVTRPGLADSPIIEMHHAFAVGQDRLPHLGMIVESGRITEREILMRITNNYGAVIRLFEQQMDTPLVILLSNGCGLSGPPVRSAYDVQTSKPG